MIRSATSAWVYLLLVFAGGAGVGAVADRLYTAKTVVAKQDPRLRYMDEMRARLKLTPDQVAKVTAVLDQTDGKMKLLHERNRPEMTLIHKQQVAEVTALLSDTQRQEYEKMRAERQKRREEEEAKHKK